MSLGNLSLRTRLILAFTILIVTSASATILIGNVVFGRKVTEQALSMTELGLNVVEYNLQGKIQRFRQLTHTGARLAAETDSAIALCRALTTDETPLDFILQIRDGAAPSLLRLGEPCVPTALGEDALTGDALGGPRRPGPGGRRRGHGPRGPLPGGDGAPRVRGSLGSL